MLRKEVIVLDYGLCGVRGWELFLVEELFIGLMVELTSVEWYEFVALVNKYGDLLL